MKQRIYEIVMIPTYKIVKTTETENSSSREAYATVDHLSLAEMIVDKLKEEDLRNEYQVKVKLVL